MISRWRNQVISGFKLLGVFNIKNPAWNPALDTDGFILVTHNIYCREALADISDFTWFPEILEQLDRSHRKYLAKSRCNCCKSFEHSGRECPVARLRRKRDQDQNVKVTETDTISELREVDSRSIRKPKWDSGSSIPIWRKKVSKKVSPTALF